MTFFRKWLLYVSKFPCIDPNVDNKIEVCGTKGLMSSLPMYRTNSRKSTVCMPFLFRILSILFDVLLRAVVCLCMLGILNSLQQECSPVSSPRPLWHQGSVSSVYYRWDTHTGERIKCLLQVRDTHTGERIKCLLQVRHTHRGAY